MMSITNIKRITINFHIFKKKKSIKHDINYHKLICASYLNLSTMHIYLDIKILVYFPKILNISLC